MASQKIKPNWPRVLYEIAAEDQRGRFSGIPGVTPDEGSAREVLRLLRAWYLTDTLHLVKIERTLVQEDEPPCAPLPRTLSRKQKRKRNPKP